VLNTLLLFLGWKRGVQAKTSALAESEAYS
jgi:hypothetical protein